MAINFCIIVVDFWGMDIFLLRDVITLTLKIYFLVL
jgi:hypothetical protein